MNIRICKNQFIALLIIPMFFWWFFSDMVLHSEQEITVKQRTPSQDFNRVELTNSQASTTSVNTLTMAALTVVRTNSLNSKETTGGETKWTESIQCVDQRGLAILLGSDCWSVGVGERATAVVMKTLFHPCQVSGLVACLYFLNVLHQFLLKFLTLMCNIVGQQLEIPERFEYMMQILLNTASALCAET